MNSIKLWWYTKVKKQVVFKEDGYTPFDCAGLQLVSGKPFEEGAVYTIDKSKINLIYLGRGSYYQEMGFGVKGKFTNDTKSPYWVKSWNKTMESYSKFKEALL